jgi:hypothetical protein
MLTALVIGCIAIGVFIGSAFVLVYWCFFDFDDWINFFSCLRYSEWGEGDGQ